MPQVKDPTIASELREVCEKLQTENRISAVAQRVPCARTTIYRALSDPQAVSVGLADRIIAAAKAELT